MTEISLEYTIAFTAAREATALLPKVRRKRLSHVRVTRNHSPSYKRETVRAHFRILFYYFIILDISMKYLRATRVIRYLKEK